MLHRRDFLKGLIGSGVALAYASVFGAVAEGSDSLCAEGERTAPMFPVCIDDRRGFMDRNGNLVIECRFERASGFSEGLAPVQVADKWGYIDRTGEIAIEPQFEYAFPFREGRAWVRIGGNAGCTRAACIDRTGTLVVVAPGPTGDSFSDGLVHAWIDGHCGYLDRSGRVAIAPQFVQASAFSEGLACVETGGSSSLWGFIDKTGRMAIPADYPEADPFSDGLACVFLEGGWGFIDRTGRVCIPSLPGRSYPYHARFSEGLAGVSIDGKMGYVDATGEIVITPQFDACRGFQEGLAPVAVDRKHGFINKRGEKVIDCDFDVVWPFEDGLAGVEVGNALGYIDKTGAYVWKPTH